MSVRARLGQIPSLRVAREVWRVLADQFGLGLRWIDGVRRLVQYAGEFRGMKRLNAQTPFALRGQDIRPCLLDRTATTPVEPTYFLQDSWLAGKLAQQRPLKHVDVGSSAKSLALVAQFVPVTFVDIRPVDIEVAGFTFLQGSVLSLPFGDESVSSLSSICVIEHIGLGRYGDPWDARGSEKAAVELSRVLAQGGDLYITVPVDDECRIYFNAHRAFTRDYLLTLFLKLELLEERYIYGRKLYPLYARERGFGTGLFHFRKV